jgi:urease accessory protein
VTATASSIRSEAAVQHSKIHRPGRDGLLRLGFELRHERTVLRHCRYTLPLQVLSPLTLEDGTSYLLMLNPTGGVLGGDHLRTEIVLAEGARACLSTPSATRIYRSNGQPGEVHTLIQLNSGSRLEYLPDHVIPHPGSSLRQSLRIEMEKGSSGIFFDGFAAGRIALNESWRFRDFDLRTEILLEGKPLFANRTKLTGDSGDSISAPPSSFNRMGGYAYCGSLVIVAEAFQKWPALVEHLREALASIPDVFGGVSLLPQSGCSARYLAHSAIEFHAATEKLWTLARRHVFNAPPLALRKY